MAREEALQKKARAAIEEHGVLLVYPIANSRDPASLWSVLYPRSNMRWAWDEGADPRVVGLWHLRERLARSREVVYGKWYKGRAVFFSRALFSAMLAELAPWRCALTPEEEEILRLLEDDSPQSSKRLREAAGLRGKASERTWTRATNALWELLLLVGTGEVEDGAFPSLEIGATRWMFEPLWEGAQRGADGAQRALLERHLPRSQSFGKHWVRIVKRAQERGQRSIYPGDIDGEI